MNNTEQHDVNELLHDEFMKGFEEGYTNAVNDALKWLTENMENYVWFLDGDCGISDDFEHDFKEAMR